MTGPADSDPREWDAETYDAISDPQFGWGMEVLGRLAATMVPHLARLPEELRLPFAEAVLDEDPKPLTLNYVRLNIEARVPAA